MTNTSTIHESSKSTVVAAIVGAVFGAVAFALCALWLGTVAGLAIALVSTLHALWRRRWWTAIAFVVAGALSAATSHPSGTFAVLAGIAYGVGLASGAPRAMQDELLA